MKFSSVHVSPDRNITAGILGIDEVDSLGGKNIENRIDVRQAFDSTCQKITSPPKHCDVDILFNKRKSFYQVTTVRML
jgi:hypothetical protein